MAFVFPEQHPQPPGGCPVQNLAPSPATPKPSRRKRHGVVLHTAAADVNSLSSVRNAWRAGLSRYGSTGLSACREQLRAPEQPKRVTSAAPPRAPLERPSTAPAERLLELDALLAGTELRVPKPKRGHSAGLRPPSRSVPVSAKAGCAGKSTRQLVNEPSSAQPSRRNALQLGRRHTAVLSKRVGKLDARTARAMLASTFQQLQRKLGITVNEGLIVRASQRLQCFVKAGDGTASFNVMDSVLKELGLTDMFLNDRIFRCLDREGTGTVRVQEFIIGLTSMLDSPLAVKMQTYFRLIDTNSNGMLSRQEVLAAVRDSGSCHNSKEVSELVDTLYQKLEVETAISSEQFCLAVLRSPSLLKVFDRIFNNQ